ncbi:hypothetical protein [Lonepinella sp. MS14435]
MATLNENIKSVSTVTVQSVLLQSNKIGANVTPESVFRQGFV